MKPHLVNIAKGQAGVYRVVSELIDHGHEPYLPVVDKGIDILLGSHIRLQVKTTQRPSNHWRQEGRWCFQLARAQRIVQRKYIKASARKFSEEVDFVILHAYQANRFWIVPAFVLDNRNTVTFADGQKQWKDCDIIEARRLRATGMSYQAIADSLGMERHTVVRRIKGTYETPKRNYADIAQYENRWDLLSGAEATLREANHIVNDPTAAESAPDKLPAR